MAKAISGLSIGTDAGREAILPESASLLPPVAVPETSNRLQTILLRAAANTGTEEVWRRRYGVWTGEISPLQPFRPNPSGSCRIAVLLSGDAPHGRALSRAIHDKQLPGCEIALVVSDTEGASGLQAARTAALPVVTIEARGRGQAEHEAALDALLRRMRIDLVLLSSYRRPLSYAFLRRWPGRVLAVHSSLLPAFPGSNALAQTLASGSQVTGCTVFVQDETPEGGPILQQGTLVICDDETENSLALRMEMLERSALIEGVRRYTSGAWELAGRRLVRSQPEF